MKRWRMRLENSDLAAARAGAIATPPVRSGPIGRDGLIAPCLRYDLLRMSPGRTSTEMAEGVDKDVHPHMSVAIRLV